MGPQYPTAQSQSLLQNHALAQLHQLAPVRFAQEVLLPGGKGFLEGAPAYFFDKQSVASPDGLALKILEPPQL